jgi:hypothetical protein
MKRTELTRTPFKRPHTQHGAYLRMAPKAAAARVEPTMRKCKVCRQPFQVFRSLQAICDGHECATAMVERSLAKKAKAAARAEAADTRAKKEAMKTQPELLEEAQKAFNSFIRARDSGKPCICCGQTNGGWWLTGGEWDAGHYRSRGAAPELRFDERNCHAQLKQCNRRAWDVATYRANLIGRIGLAEVEALEGQHQAKKYTKDELRELRDTYRVKAREAARAAR